MAALQRLQARHRALGGLLGLQRLDLQSRADGAGLLLGRLLGDPSARREHHREAWAVEQTAPLRPEAGGAAGGERRGPAGQRRIVPARSSRPAAAEAPTEVLIVASRLKEYIRAKSGMKTSERVLAPLSDIVRRVCDEAIGNARREGRTTVLDRDIPGD